MIPKQIPPDVILMRMLMGLVSTENLEVYKDRKGKHRIIQVKKAIPFHSSKIVYDGKKYYLIREKVLIAESKHKKDLIPKGVANLL